MLSLWLLLLPLLYSSVAVGHQLKKRWLVFPRQAPTRHQFIGGIGIPADLEYESLVVGHVLKAEFFLPYNASVYRENSFFPEYKVPGHINARQALHKITRRSKLRWDLYAYIIERLNSYGCNGEACMLHAICEANSVRFERNINVFAELLHIMLSPTTSSDADSLSNQHFIEAEKLGRFGASNACANYECNLTLLDLVSRILHVDI